MGKYMFGFHYKEDTPRHRALWPKPIEKEEWLPSRYAPVLKQLHDEGHTISGIIFVPQVNWWTRDRLEYMIAWMDENSIVIIKRQKKGEMEMKTYTPDQVKQISHTIALIDTCCEILFVNKDGGYDNCLFHYNSVTEQYFTQFFYHSIGYTKDQEYAIHHENPFGKEIRKVSYFLANYCERCFYYDEEILGYYMDEVPRKDKQYKKSYRSVNEYFLAPMNRGLIYTTAEHNLKRVLYTDWDVIDRIVLEQDEKVPRKLAKLYPGRNLFIRIYTKDGKVTHFPVREETRQKAEAFLKQFGEMWK